MQRITLSVALLCFVITTFAEDYARIRIVHAFPGQNVNVSINLFDGSSVYKSFPNVGYKDATPWFYVPWGTYNYSISLVGQQNPLLKGNVIVQDSYSFVLVALSVQGSLSLSVVTDDITTIPPDSSRLQAFHAAVGVNGADFGTDDIQLTNLAENLAFNTIGMSFQVTPSSYTVSVRATGNTGAPAASTTVDIEVGRGFLIIAVGTAANDAIPLELIAIEMLDFASNARISFVHAIPASPSVNVNADDTPIFRNIAYKESTEYYNLIPNTVVLTVGSAITVTSFFNGFTESTLVATSDSSNSPTGILILDDNSAPDSGKARIRVVHAAGAAPTVDVLTGNTVIVPGLAFSFTSDYLSTSAVNFSVSVAPAGTTNAVLTTTLAVPSDAVVTVIAVGNTADTSSASAFALLVVVDARYGSNGFVRGLHAIAGADQVDATTNNDPFFTALVYKNITDYQSVAPGLYRLYWTTPGFDQAILRSSLRIDAGSYFTAIIGGQIGGQLVLFQLRDENSVPQFGNTNVRIVHASASSPEVTVNLNGNAVGSLVYKESYGYAPLSAGSYGVTVSTTSDNKQVLSGTLPLHADTVTSVFALGVVGDATYGFELLQVRDFDYSTPSSIVPSTPTQSPEATPEDSSSHVISANILLMIMIIVAFAY